MTQTTTSLLSAALTFRIQRTVLQNLRGALVYADPAYAETGEFGPGFDTISFAKVPDITLNTTPLTEGTKPTARALSLTTVTVSTSQLGDLVSITDLAKVKSPVDLSATASERVTRQAAESIDQVARDVIASGGTAFYSTVSANTQRSDIATTDLISTAGLRQLRATMYKHKIPPFGDGLYRIWIDANQGFDLRNDTTAVGGFIPIHQYTDPTPVLNGELGRLEGFRIMEVVNAPTFSSTTTVYAAIAMGGVKGWGHGDVQTLQIGHVPAVMGGDHTDPLGQEELVGWKCTFGVGVLNNGYYYRFETAATSL